MENYRTFVGIPLKVDAAFLTDRAALMLSLEGERVSWVRPENFHLTLRFLGDVPTGSVDELGAALDHFLVPPAVKIVDLTGPGVFGPRKKPRVIWVGFEDGGYFADIRRQVDLALESCGFPASEQEFRAHLTLGRIRGLKNPQDFYKLMEAHHHRFATEVRAEKVVLFRSVLEPKGPKYIPLKTWSRGS